MRNDIRPTRVSEVIEQPVDDDIVVYGLSNDDVHLLNATSAAVWRRCDGESTVDEITASVAEELGAPVGTDVVWAALAELDRAGLLVDHIEAPTRLSRRQLMKRLAIAAVAVPVVTSIVAPTAAAAASSCTPNGSSCSLSSDCCSGFCNPATEQCANPQQGCGQSDAVCETGVECCSGTCLGGFCTGVNP